jgi:cobalamin-dependent methionine synthase I
MQIIAQFFAEISQRAGNISSIALHTSIYDIVAKGKDRPALTILETIFSVFTLIEELL